MWGSSSVLQDWVYNGGRYEIAHPQQDGVSRPTIHTRARRSLFKTHITSHVCSSFHCVRNRAQTPYRYALHQVLGAGAPPCPLGLEFTPPRHLPGMYITPLCSSAVEIGPFRVRCMAMQVEKTQVNKLRGLRI